MVNIGYPTNLKEIRSLLPIRLRKVRIRLILQSSMSFNSGFCQVYCPLLVLIVFGIQLFYWDRYWCHSVLVITWIRLNWKSVILYQIPCTHVALTSQWNIFCFNVLVLTLVLFLVFSNTQFIIRLYLGILYSWLKYGKITQPLNTITINEY